MAELELHTQPCTSGSDGAGALQTKQVKQHIADLPPFDMDGRIDGLSDLLTNANQTGLALNTRVDLLDLVDPQVHDLISGYQEKVNHYAFPLSERSHARYLKMQALLSHTASAYKRLIIDLLEECDEETLQVRLRAPVMQCINYITQQALQAYAVYQEAPSFIWEDLHHLYAYAEKKQLATDVVEHLSDLSVSGAYARTLLLAISNPGHLLQGEIYQTYEKLGKWGLAVRLEHPEELPPGPLDELMLDHFYCDLAGSSPPDFFMKGRSTLPLSPRRLNLNEVLNIINSRMKDLAVESRRSLKLRAEWDLLLRLRQAWEKRPVRKSTRKPECGVTIKAIVSLSSSHYFFSGYLPFEPEKAEAHLHGDGFEQPQALSLISTESSPWLEGDTETKLESGILKPRSYSFDVEQNEDDVWKKSHSTARHQESRIEKGVEDRMLETIYEFNLVNTSRGGEGLETLPGSKVQLRVGELLALFPHGDEEGDEPALHIVRWIQADTDLTLHMGVHQIEGEPEPLAVRALDSEAVFKDYVRAFLLENNEQTSIIVPAGQFECGVTLVTNDSESLRLFKLEAFLENTRAFSRFKCKQIELNQQATENIVKSLKTLLGQERG